MDEKRRIRAEGGSGTGMANPPNKMRKSCDACALAKRKCDGKTTCSLCFKRGSPCVYSERQKSGPKKAISKAGEATASSTAKPAVNPPAQSKTSEQPDISGPPPPMTAMSSDPPQHKRIAQRDSTGDWLSAPSCLEAKATTDLSAGKAVFTSSSSRQVHKKAKKVTKEHQQAHLQPRIRKDVARAVSETRPVSSPSTTRAMPMSMPTPTPSTKLIVGPIAKPLSTQAACTHPLMAADSEAEELHSLPILMSQGEVNIPTGPNLHEAHSEIRQVPDLPTLSVEQTVGLESSTDSSSLGWEDLSDMFVSNLEDEILWGCDDTSDDGSVFGTGMGSIIGTSDDSLVSGSMSSSGARGGITTTECGILGTARLFNGRQQQQQQLHHQHHQHHLEHLYRQNHLVGMSQSPLSSTSIVSLLQPVSHEYKSITFSDPGSAGPGFRLRPRERLRSGHGIVSMARRVRANAAISSIGGLDGGTSPISSWTQEAVEAGASTLLAVLADEETGPSLGNNVAGIAGAGGQTESNPRAAWPMNLNSSDVTELPISMNLADPGSRQMASSSQTRNMASHDTRNMAEPLEFEGTTRRWAISKPNMASF